MADTTATSTTAKQIIMLEREALDRWGNGDPGGFLEVYAAGREPVDQPSGQREYGARDLEGHRWWFSMPVKARS